MNTNFARPLTATERVITTSDDTKISTVSMGSGTPIVLAHGYALDMHCWNIVADELVARGFKVGSLSESNIKYAPVAPASFLIYSVF